MRIAIVDAIRGLAILMMVAYHILFDLDYLGIADIDLHWLPILLFQRTTGSLFILVAGISMVLSESRNREGYPRHFRRAVILGAVAACITLVTWIYPHERYITFGIIHFLAVSALIAPLFFRLGRYNIALALIAIAAGLVLNGMDTEAQWLFPLGLANPGYTALDYYPLLPWFGVILLGIYAGQKLFLKEIAWGGMPGWLTFMGRNSLAIYLIHQPVLIGIMLAAKTLL